MRRIWQFRLLKLSSKFGRPLHNFMEHGIAYTFYIAGMGFGVFDKVIKKYL